MQTVPELRRRVLSARWTSYGIKHFRAKGHASAARRKAKDGAQKEESVNLKEKVAPVFNAGRKPPLIEQLFPEETRRYEEAKRQAVREIPKLPLEAPASQPSRARQQARTAFELEQPKRLWQARKAQQEVERGMHKQGVQTSVLVLRNASPNLVEEDFRRLIPRGKHMEGWTLEQGDILKIVPGRDLATLAQQNFYYLLFSSQLSAFAYQGHVTRIYHLAAAHTPDSVLSPIAAPKGYMVDGIDVRDAIESFALVPPTQKMELRQLRAPLSPMLQALVRYQGYPSLVNRTGKSPFEVRLTLEGPQLHAGTIRWILQASGKARALSWSGGDEIIPKITKWEVPYVVAPQDHEGWRHIAERSEEEQAQRDLSKLHVLQSRNEEEKRRMPPVVHIVGFHTEHAAQTFMHYWHRRPMTWKGVDSGKDDGLDDLPPIANVEMLW